MRNDVYKVGNTHYKLSGIYSMTPLRRNWRCSGELIGTINGNVLTFVEHSQDFDQETSEYIKLFNIFVGNEVINEK